jgi:NDP-sugar pyrophosphorylase family protein
LPLLASSPFLIVNGDTLTDVNIGALVADHRRSGALVTLAVVPNTQPGKYGGVLVETDGAVSGFTRRQSSTSTARTAATTSFHFVGVQIAEAEVFAPLPDNVPSESVAARYPALIAARPGSVRAFVTAAEFFDIGTPDDYLRTALLLATRQSHRAAPESLLAGARTHIASSACLTDSVVWDDVVVDSGVRLHGCVVTDDVRVPAGSSWENVTIRQARGDLIDSERLVGELAIASIR